VEIPLIGADSGIGVLVYWFVKRQQKRKIEEEVYKTPIEKQLTEHLRTKGTLAKGEVKATIVN
jgi:hypothetical protein